jgi:hypothetical protein
MQKVSQQGTMFDKLMQYMQLSLMLAMQSAPQYVQQIAMDMQNMGGVAPGMGGSPAPQMMQSDNIAGIPQKEHGIVTNAREKAQNASQPNSSGAVKEKKK